MRYVVTVAVGGSHTAQVAKQATNCDGRTVTPDVASHSIMRMDTTHIEKLGGDRYRVHVCNRHAEIRYSVPDRGFTVDFGDGAKPSLIYPSLSTAAFDAAAVLKSLIASQRSMYAHTHAQTA